MRISFTLACLLMAWPADWAPAQTRLLRLEAQTRDPKTSQVLPQTIEVESSKVAVVIVDPWNFHWCMTACERVSAMVPRWNRALECARKLGLPVLWVPSDVVGMYSGYAQIGSVHAGFFWLPKTGQSYEGQPLRVRGRVYARGLGCRAPSGVRYALKPEYDRFVALAGIDDTMIGRDLGQKLAIHSSVVFRVFVDGVQAAESPVMRVSQEPWRFDVPIPPGSRYLHLACMDAGTRHLADLGNWVEAGFVLKEGEARTKLRAARENGAWRAIQVPGYWERARGGQWADYNGTAWYRCYVKIPPSWAGRDAELHVERVDNRHETLFEGRKVAEGVLDQSDYSRARLSAATLRPGSYHLVAVRVEDVGGAGGFAGLAPVVYCGEDAIEFKGDWEFRTGDDASWARGEAAASPPGFARFERVVPATSVSRHPATAR